jgi:hypothetical protein
LYLCACFVYALFLLCSYFGAKVVKIGDTTKYLRKKIGVIYNFATSTLQNRV